MKKLFLYLFFLITVAFLGFAISPYTQSLLLNLGIIGESVPISGTGSMYPTFPKSEGVTEKEASEQTVAQPVMKRFPEGLKFLGKDYFSYQLQRGDIVEFENDKTKDITLEKYGTDSGFVKRLVALPGDTIEFRDGYFYLNGRIQTEPYTARARSTYGGTFVPDCRAIKVPSDSVFVLGDNRKASLDSRFDLGFVKISDIHHVLPLKDQSEFEKNWRDTSNDLKIAHTATTDPQDFVDLVNNLRQKKDLTPLKLNEKLNQSSYLRGKTILETDDFSIEATKSGLTVEKAISQAGYRNVVFAELFTRGFYDAQELIDNFSEFPDTAGLLFSSEYQDIGLSAVLSDVKNCPTQVIVIHLGGYKPPNYRPEDIESWQTLIENLDNILPSWEGLKGADNINQDKLNSLLTLLHTRLDHAKIIYNRLSQNQWLTDEENSFVEQDKILHQQAEKLITELNQ